MNKGGLPSRIRSFPILHGDKQRHPAAFALLYVVKQKE